MPVSFLNESLEFALKIHKRRLPLAVRVEDKAQVEVKAAAVVFNDPVTAQHARVTQATSLAIRSDAKLSSANSAQR